MAPEIYIHGYRMVLVCMACPERYDVYDRNDVIVAQIKLRHGNLRALDPGGSCTIYSTDRVHGDGVFDSDERFKKLKECIEKMIEWFLNEPHAENGVFNFN